MAWIDDRIWCHPKLADISDSAFRVYVNGVAYSSGFHTSGTLTAGQQRAIGATARTRTELVKARLWEIKSAEDVAIHDWAEHNAKRDARRKADRERKRLERAKTGDLSTSPSGGLSAGHTNGQHRGQGADKRADRRTLTGDRVTSDLNPAAALATQAAANGAAAELLERIEALGIDPDLINGYHPTLVDAWLDAAATHADRNPAGFVLTGLRTGQPPADRATQRPPVDYHAKARELYQRTADPEQVADWLAAQTRLSLDERDRILEQACD